MKRPDINQANMPFKNTCNTQHKFNTDHTIPAGVHGNLHPQKKLKIKKIKNKKNTEDVFAN